jgi:dimethylargininase
VPIAFTRALSPRIADCELTYLDRAPIDFARAEAQHDAYQQLLERNGCTIVSIEPATESPDGVFVEDAVIALDEIAVITRPGAASRRGETESVARALARYRALHQIVAPATIDGGDVLCVGKTLYAGRSKRTNDEGIAQLRAAIAPFGYSVIAVDFRGCLHLKSAVTQLDEQVLLFNPGFVEPFRGFEMVPVDPAEPDAANVLRLGDGVIIAAEHERTVVMLSRRWNIAPVSMSELLKAEAGVTCCSVIIEERT